MAQRKGGIRRKTRHKLSRPVRERGKINVSALFREFHIGEKVVLKQNPAVQKGTFPPDYTGRHGIITAKKGKCYEVTLRTGRKNKELIVHPVHLKRCQ